ncbi:MAG: flagellar biosynthesis repressor FlbT [Betaproteobacteria bacterium]|nr:flagellar biosynthesis repressor FlbT [Betaproteobacteria bacterium]
MPLKISLKPREKFFIGGAVVENGDSHADLTILNDVPLLREKDVMTEQEADSPCRRIYLCVQSMYMDPVSMTHYQQQYRRMLDEVTEAAPSTGRFVADINTHLASGRYYQAMKAARHLVEYEQELISHAKECA